MTPGGAAAALIGLIVWCKACQYQVEPDPTEIAARYGPGPPFSIGASGWSVPAGAAGTPIGGERERAAVAPPLAAHTVASTRAKRPGADVAFGLQMPRASSTIAPPAITISEAAPAPAQKPAAQSSA
jgi:hypothetical protein